MLPFPDRTLYQGIADVADRRPDGVAIIDGTERVTFQDLVTRSRRLAGGLASLGVEPGETIAIWLSNGVEWVQSQLAASYLGAAAVAVNTRYRTDELAYMLDDADCAVLVTETAFLDTDYLAMLADVVPSVRTAAPESFSPTDLALEAVVAVDEAPEFEAVQQFEAVVGADTPPVEPADDPTAPVAVFYTSGTTGDPKGCLQSSRSVLNHSALSARHLGVTGTDVVLGALPFPGVWGFNTWLGTLAQGATLVVQSHFEPEEATRLVRDHQITTLSGMAVMFTRMLDARSMTWAESLERGVICFLTLSYDPDTFEWIEEAVGFPLVQPYGLSEGNSQIFVGRRDVPLAVRKRVGGPLVSAAQEAKIVDPETGDRRAEGEAGELCLRGYNIMNGYLGKPAATADAIDQDGWLHTGDLCSRDGDILEYHARLDDALRVRGFLVTPREIEVAIDDVVGVEQTQVVGAPHSRHGQVPVAFVRRSDTAVSADDIRGDLEGRLADYKIPAAVSFVESFPRTESPHGDKVQKHTLRERAQELVSSE